MVGPDYVTSGLELLGFYAALRACNLAAGGQRRYYHSCDLAQRLLRIVGPSQLRCLARMELHDHGPAKAAAIASRLDSMAIGSASNTTVACANIGIAASRKPSMPA